MIRYKINNFKFFFLTFFELFLLIDFSKTQSIFDQVKTCVYEFKSNQITLNNDLWNVTSETGHGKVYLFRFCKPISQTFCDRDSYVCLYDSTKPNSSISFNKPFKVSKYDKKEVLISKSRIPCPGGIFGNYAFIITIDNIIVDKKAWHFISESRCEIHISIRPNVQPDCTSRIRGNLIDFRSARNKEIIVNSNNRKFVLSLCGPAKSCKDSEASGCEISNGNVVKLIADTGQKIEYRDNALVVKSTKLGSKTTININCDWERESVEGTYFTKSFKFNLKSIYGCVKYPMKCIIQDSDNFHYDLSKLYNSKLPWNVKNVTDGKVLLNMCGPLKSENNECDHQFSQICHLKTNKGLNYGSILKELKVDDNDVITANFIGGNSCPKHPTKQLSTLINFECSSIEMGPVLVNSTDCTYKLSWKTPHACPNYKRIGDNCQISDEIGNRNLNELHTNKDRIHNLSKSSFIRYNFCGTLAESCKNVTNVSLCLNVNNEEFILGYFNKELISEKNKLFMQFKGDYCRNKSYESDVMVNFECNLASSVAGIAHLKVNEDGCSYIMNIKTPLACTSRNKVNCVVKNELQMFNLSSLALTNKNYIVKDGNVDYILNLCNPIINTENTFCRAYSGVCSRNNTEPNIKHKYALLGQLRAPEFLNGELFVRYVNGRFCYDEMCDFETKIIFICSKFNSKIMLKSKTKCKFEFTWETKYACPKRLVREINSCIYENNSYVLDISKIDKKKFRLIDDFGSSFTFNLCSNFYDKLVKENNEQIETKVTLLNETDQYFLRYKLLERCENQNYSFVDIYLICDTSSEKAEYNFQLKENCVYKFSLKHASICNEKATPIAECHIPNELPETFKINNVSYDFKPKKKCPTIIYEQSLIKLIYANEACAPGGIFKKEVQFRCNESLEYPHVANESQCSTVVVYPTNKACALLNLPRINNNKHEIIGGVIGTVVFISLVVFLFIWIKRRKSYNNLDKDNTPIYFRNTRQ